MPDASANPFSSIDDYLAIPRVAGVVLSPDGTRLVCPVQTLSPDRTKYVTSLWDVDPRGERAARRLTWGAKGESSPAFTPGGDLLFVAKRSEVVRPPSDQPDVAEPPDDVAALWLLPAGGGEARELVAAASDISAVRVASAAGTVVVTAGVLPGPFDGDAARRKARKDAGVSALLHEASPVRQWDHDLGPDEPRLLAVEIPDGDGRATLRDLTPDPGRGLDDAEVDISADGSFLAVGWQTPQGRGLTGRDLVVIDVATGERRVLGASRRAADGEPARHYTDPSISRDGRYVVCCDEREADFERAPVVTLRLFDVRTGESRDLLPEFPSWPQSPVFGADSRSVFFVADEQGNCPVFKVDVETSALTRLVADGAFTSLCPSPDGQHVYSLRISLDRAPTPVRLDASAPDQKPFELDAPGKVDVPGRIEEIRTTAPDGAQVRAWLALPDAASADAPAPLALWVHGGPLMSWNSWSWRWNPWLLVARGWAVLMPDPALSRGYGFEFMQRGWGKWGPTPFADLMAITDTTAARPDIDGERTAMMGGSYGGYMANWIAGHTDRFKAIVSHASLWTLSHFTGATDHPAGWELEWGHPLEQPERYELNDPSRHGGNIRTPMLVIHGDRDYRVPIGEGLRLWYDLVRQGVDAKFLYFPDENHWVLKPGNAKVWYQTVFAFLDHHVLGAPWARPELL